MEFVLLMLFDCRVRVVSDVSATGPLARSQTHLAANVDRKRRYQRFGKPKSSEDRFWWEYQTEFEQLYVEYSRGPCKLPNNQGWRVAEGVVTRLFYAPKERRKPSYFGLKSRKFSKKEVSDAPGNFVFDSGIRGISFGVRRDGTVEDILLYPSEKFDNLRCGQDQRSTK
ncbi:MAG: hypothetical protein IPJ30_12920 [Acidobacteria bacterium]|nr:hypothetical protein [Acidobacteriota bacterium]